MEQIELKEVDRLAADIDTRLRALSSLKTANVRAVRREFSKRLARASSQVVIELALQLLDRPGFASRFVAYELVSYHRAALRSLGERELEQLGHGIDSWEDVDTFACYLAGPAWRQR